MNKVVVVGAGMVGASYAYSLVNQEAVDELVLIDRLQSFAQAHADDIRHGNVFLGKQAKIYAGTYADCHDADLVCITAGAPQKPGETRLDLAQTNALIVKDIVEQVIASGFNGILLIATNPVDVMTYVAQKVSGFPDHQVVGSGTTLDSARFRQNLSDYLDCNPRHIHAKIIGEHGDSSLPLWSSATIGPKPILDLVNENPELYSMDGLNKCFTDARDAAYSIIKEKGSTYFGIGISLANITKSILGDQKSVLSLSTKLNGEYGLEDLYIPVPVLVGKNGVDHVLKLNITPSELESLQASGAQIKAVIENLKQNNDFL